MMTAACCDGASLSFGTWHHQVIPPLDPLSLHGGQGCEVSCTTRYTIRTIGDCGASTPGTSTLPGAGAHQRTIQPRRPHTPRSRMREQDWICANNTWAHTPRWADATADAIVGRCRCADAAGRLIAPRPHEPGIGWVGAFAEIAVACRIVRAYPSGSHCGLSHLAGRMQQLIQFCDEYEVVVAQSVRNVREHPQLQVLPAERNVGEVSLRLRECRHAGRERRC